MRKMTLREIQSVGLDIMKEIHSFCMENGIEYSLAYGSMIGAVRHKGYIPWDDDIDLWMTRPNFEKFNSTFQSKKGFRLMSVYDKDNYCNFTRIYETEKTHVIYPAKACPFDVGVWVDVFPIDGISDDFDTFKQDYATIRTLGKRILKARYDMRFLERGNLYEKTRSVIKLLFKKIFLGGISGMHKKIVDLCKTYSFEESTYCASLVCVEAIRNNKPETFPKTDFSTYTLMPFESEMLMVSTHYDHILTTIFGDYMQIPPKEKQIAHALKNWQFNWKD